MKVFVDGSPFRIIEDRLVDVIAQATKLDRSYVVEKLQFSLEPGIDFILQILAEENIDPLVSAEGMDATLVQVETAHDAVKVMLNYDSSLGKSIFASIETLDRNYGLSNIGHIPESVGLRLYSKSNEVYDSGAFMGLSVAGTSIAQMFSVLGSRVPVTVCVSDVEGGGFKVDIPIDSYTALTTDPISIFRAQSNLQAMRTKLRRGLRQGLLSAGTSVLRSSAIEFSTDQYTYSNLLNLAYHWVSQTGGAIINDTPCVRVNETALFPVLAYGETVFQLGDLLAAIVYANSNTEWTVHLVPDSHDWHMTLAMLNVDHKDPRILVLAPHEVDVVRAQPSAEHDHAVRAPVSLNSEDYFLALLRGGSRKRTQKQLEKARNSFKLMCRMFAKNGSPTDSGKVSSSNADTASLLRLFVRFPCVVREAAREVEPALIASFLVEITAEYFAVLNRQNVPEQYQRVYRTIVFNGLSLLGLTVDKQDSPV